MDEAWYSELFRQNYALLYRLGRMLLVDEPSMQQVIEDQIQNTFLLAWQQRKRLMHHPNPRGWLVVTFRNGLRNHYRKQIREKKCRIVSLDDTTVRQLPDTNELTADAFLQNEDQRSTLVSLLGERDAELFITYCVDGQTANEVGHQYSMSDDAVRMRVSRIKKKLIRHIDLFLGLIFMIVTMKGGAGL